MCYCKIFILGFGEFKDKYVGVRIMVIYEVNGDKCKIFYLISLYFDKFMVYDIEIGKLFDGKGLDGLDVKVSINWDKYRLLKMN